MPKQIPERRPDDELTLRDIEAEYPVSGATVRRRIRDGALRGRRIVGRIVVRRADLEAVLYGEAAAR